MRAIFVELAIFAEEFLQPHLWWNAINLAITQGGLVRSQHSHGNERIRIMGISERESQIFAHIVIQVKFSLFDQLHNREHGKHLGDRSYAKTAFAGKGVILLWILAVDNS